MNNKSIITGSIVFAASVLLGGGFYQMLAHKTHHAQEHDIGDIEEHEVVTLDAGMQPNIVERVISSSQLWRPVQEKVSDTVVQLFAHVLQKDLLRPYAPPAQGTATGSAFFINDEGYLVTNAHVVNEAAGIWMQIPSLGKRILDVEIVGVSPDRDLALLKVSDEGLDIIRRELGGVPYLPLGNSDLVRRSDDLLALGYPLGQQSLKSTTGVVSGREDGLIQISAPINPGNSGGPTINTRGEVIGVNSSGVLEAQNVGYAIPINDLKVILNDLKKVKLLRRPFLGVLFNNANEALTEYLGNPEPGGCYVVEVVRNSPLDKVGVKTGDMIYAINGHAVDMFGEMKLPFSEDKMSIINYVSRLKLGEQMRITIYRNGSRKEFELAFDLSEKAPIHEVYPGFEELDWEVFGGMVVMPLVLNHIPILGKHAPGLAKYLETRYQSEPTLIITHIFPNSQLYRSRSLPVGSTINEVNGIRVRTLDEFRHAIKQSEQTHFLTIRASDNVSRKSENLLVALPWKKVLQEEPKLAADFRYPVTQMAQSLLQNN
ncbi:MAG: Protease Do, partial [uncultured bacterium]